MRFSVGARLMVASDAENCEIHAESDENRAEGDADHAEPPEKKQTGCQRQQTSKEKTKCHASQRQPSAKTCKENDAYQHDRSKQCRHNVVTHAQGNLRHKSWAPGHEDLQRTALPAFCCGRTKFIHPAH